MRWPRMLFDMMTMTDGIGVDGMTFNQICWSFENKQMMRKFINYEVVAAIAILYLSLGRFFVCNNYRFHCWSMENI